MVAFDNALVSRYYARRERLNGEGKAHYREKRKRCSLDFFACGFEFSRQAGGQRETESLRERERERERESWASKIDQAFRVFLSGSDGLQGHESAKLPAIFGRFLI